MYPIAHSLRWWSPGSPDNRPIPTNTIIQQSVTFLNRMLAMLYPINNAMLKCRNVDEREGRDRVFSIYMISL